MVWRYESPTRHGHVPERAAEVMRDLLVDREASAEQIADNVAVTAEGFIPRHGELALFEEWIPAMTGWGRTAQGLVLAEVQQRLQLPVEYL